MSYYTVRPGKMKAVSQIVVVAALLASCDRNDPNERPEKETHEPKVTLELGGSYRDVLKGELIDPVLRFENPGEKRIMYLGPTSALPMDFNQIFYCFFDSGKQVLSTRSIPTYLNETWRNIESSQPTYLEPGEARYYLSMSFSWQVGQSFDAVAAEMLIGPDTWITSNRVEAPNVIEGEFEHWPKIAAFPLDSTTPGDGKELEFRRVKISGHEFLYAKASSMKMVIRVARLPTGSVPSIREIPSPGETHPTLLVVAFGRSSYEDLLYNPACYEILAGHPDTVPNAFMRSRWGFLTEEQVERCRDENRSKPWLRGQDP